MIPLSNFGRVTIVVYLIVGGLLCEFVVVNIFCLFLCVWLCPTNWNGVPSQPFYTCPGNELRMEIQGPNGSVIQVKFTHPVTEKIKERFTQSSYVFKFRIVRKNAARKPAEYNYYDSTVSQSSILTHSLLPILCDSQNWVSNPSLQNCWPLDWSFPRWNIPKRVHPRHEAEKNENWIKFTLVTNVLQYGN